MGLKTQLEDQIEENRILVAQSARLQQQLSEQTKTAEVELKEMRESEMQQQEEVFSIRRCSLLNSLQYYSTMYVYSMHIYSIYIYIYIHIDIYIYIYIYIYT